MPKRLVSDPFFNLGPVQRRCELKELYFYNDKNNDNNRGKQFVGEMLNKIFIILHIPSSYVTRQFSDKYTVEVKLCVKSY